MDYLIRPASAQDLPELLYLMQEHAAYERTSFCAEGKQEHLHQALFQAPIRLYCDIVVRHGALVGYVTYTFDFSTWDATEFMYMDCLFLLEEARGTGIGTAIMDRLSHIAITRGCINIQWQTPDFNESAIRFYNRIGAMEKQKARFTWMVKGPAALP